jgi:hypothetical protein
VGVGSVIAIAEGKAGGLNFSNLAICSFSSSVFFRSSGLKAAKSSVSVTPTVAMTCDAWRF